MRRSLCVLWCALMLGACGSQEEIIDTSWQVANVYTTPDYPAAVPDAVAGAVTINFGASTISGFTGCAPLQGTVNFNREGQPATSVDGDALHVDDIKFRPIDEAQCTGHIRFVHDAIVKFFEHPDFRVTRPTGGELLLTVRSDNAYEDQPALRLVH
ncbi:MAG: hypothetical protein Q4A82_03125 [Corynebacterium sp.]|nr:hypothetical protein [Corynebacterium sp.]